MFPRRTLVRKALKVIGVLGLIMGMLGLVAWAIADDLFTTSSHAIVIVDDNLRS
jgi:hypothetical protein